MNSSVTLTAIYNNILWADGSQEIDIISIFMPQKRSFFVPDFFIVDVL